MISDKPWTVESVFRLFLAIIITYCLGMMLMAGLSALATRSGPSVKPALSPDQLQMLQMLCGSIFVQVTALGWIAVFLRLHNMSWKAAFGFGESNPPKVAAYGLAVGLLFFPIGIGLQSLSINALQQCGLNPQEQVAIQALENPHITLPAKIVLGALAIVAAPLAEESLFRGIIYTSLKQRGWRGAAWWGTSALFAFMHNDMASFVPLLAFAMVLNFLYEAYGNLLVPIMAHGVFNAVNFAAVMFPNQIERLFHLK